MWTNPTSRLYATAIFLFIIASPFIGWALANQFPLFPPVTSNDYPPATRDLAVIETWTEEEVNAFAKHLGCFEIQLNWDFEEQHPKAAAFCSDVTGIWAQKYRAQKTNKLNWDLFNSLSE